MVSVDSAAVKRAEGSSKIAGYSLGKVKRWLHEVAIEKIDPETGLYLGDGKWNYRDTAADCYPFLCWAAHVTDIELLHGPIRDVLDAERKLCNHLDRVPVRFDLKKGSKDHARNNFPIYIWPCVVTEENVELLPISQIDMIKRC
jgi:hypothetical protein